MKLLVDARSLGSHPSGIGMYLYDFLIELLKQPDFEITLLSDIATSDEMLSLAKQGVPIVTYGAPISQSVQVLRYFRFVQNFLDNYHPDLFWEPNNLIPIRLKHFTGKILVTIHDVFPLTQPENHGHIYPIYFKYGLKQTMKQADGITYNSLETKREVEQRFPQAAVLPNRISYIIIKHPDRNNVLPSPMMLFPDLIHQKEDYFLYIGNLEKRKGTDLLLKAYHRYRASGGTQNLYLGGKIREADIQKLYDTVSQDTPGLVSLGYVNEEQKAVLFEHCSAFLFPSRAEGFGIPVIEAMHYNKPILASNLSIFEEIAGNAISYYDCTGSEQEQIEKLSEAMFQIAPADKTLYASICSRYLPDRLGPDFCQFIRSLLT